MVVLIMIANLRLPHEHHANVKIPLSFAALVFSRFIIVLQKMPSETCAKLEVEYTNGQTFVFRLYVLPDLFTNLIHL